MAKDIPSLNLAEADPVTRLKARLSQSRTPTTQNQTNNWVNWDGMSEVLGQPFDSTKIPISKLEQMRRDSMLAFGLSFCKVPLIRAPWYIQSSDAQRAAFIDGALRRIYGRFILAYTNSFDFGFSAICKRFEDGVPDWTYVNESDLGSNSPDAEKDVWPDKDVNALLWKTFLPLSPRVAAPHWNAKGEFAGIDLGPNAGAGDYGWKGFSNFPWANGVSGSGKQGRPADIPLDWALWATNEKDSVFGSLWGYPRLGYSYRYWWSYWYKFGLADRAFERWADPPLGMYYPTDIGLDSDGESVDFSGVALGALEQFRSGANAAIPGNVVRSDMDRATSVREWEVFQMESTANFDALNQMFEYLDVQKLRSVMVPEQALVEGKGGTSSRNVAATFGDLFAESQAVVMEEIDEHINRYMIPQLLEANFGPGGASCTKITTGFDPQDIETMRLIVGGLANIAPGTLPVDTRELLKRLSIPLLSHTAHQQELERQAELAAKAQPPQIEGAGGGPGGTKSGVSNFGQYYQPREEINLDQPLSEQDNDEVERTVGLMERLFSVFKKDDKEEKAEPQEVKLTFAVEVEEPDSH